MSIKNNTQILITEGRYVFSKTLHTEIRRRLQSTDYHRAEVGIVDSILIWTLTSTYL